MKGPGVFGACRVILLCCSSGPGGQAGAIYANTLRD